MTHGIMATIELVETFNINKKSDQTVAFYIWL